MSKMAVIGAGLAGLACAAALRAAGQSVVLFDKGRAAGGRLATRRAEAFRFDHGAQYLPAADAACAAAWRAAGAVDWPATGGLLGVPGMSALPRALAEGCETHFARQVVALEGGTGGWQLRHAEARAPQGPSDAAGPFDAVLLTLPAPQAGALLAGHGGGFDAALRGVAYDPCWTLMAAFPERLALPDTLRAPNDVVAWAARDSAKPGRDAATECWVVQATGAWSTAKLELAADVVIPLLLPMLSGGMPAPQYAAAHRWRYAFATRPLGEPCLWDAARGLGWAGDGALGGLGDAAWRSGRALAARVLAA